MDEDGIPEVLKTERMGHEMPGMHGVYGHVSPAMRAILKAALQARWEGSLRERAQLCPRSIVPTLDALLAAYRQAQAKIRSQLAPKIGQRRSGRRVPTSRLGHMTCEDSGGAEGIRTPDPLDANEVRYRTAPQPRELELA
jgi:hypothetical protein